MSGVRERASDSLLRFGADSSLDRAALSRSLATVPVEAPGRTSALGAVEVARWVDTAVLWVSWRLRSRRITL